MIAHIISSFLIQIRKETSGESWKEKKEMLEKNRNAQVPVERKDKGAEARVYGKTVGGEVYPELLYFRQVRKSGSMRLHYYNNIAFTPTPFYISVFIFYSVLAGIVYDMKLEYLMIYVLTPLIMFVGHIFTWINELSSESVYYGRYNSKIRMSLLVGFILFLVSEAMLFLGFFWTFFDRLFALPAHVPQVYTIEHINCTGAPLLGTALLIASGYCANISFYQANSYVLSRMMHRVSIVLGMAFLAIQVYEYQELMSSISYNVFFSIFFVLTGFHGFHVIVGLLFLLSNDYILGHNMSVQAIPVPVIQIIKLYIRFRGTYKIPILLIDKIEDLHYTGAKLDIYLRGAKLLEAVVKRNIISYREVGYFNFDLDAIWEEIEMQDSLMKMRYDW